MYKKKKTIISPNFLDAKRSTYKRVPLIPNKRGMYSTVIAIFFVFIVGMGVNYLRVEAEDYTQKVIASTDNDNSGSATQPTKTIYIEKAPEIYPYDERTVTVVEENLRCIKDDRILQWQKGTKQWECVRPSKAVFGISSDSNVEVSRSGAIECENDGEFLYWDDDDDQWMCGTTSSAVVFEEINGIDVPSPASNEVLAYVGGEWTNAPISSILAAETLSSISVGTATISNLQGVTSIDATTAATISSAVSGNYVTHNGNSFGEAMVIGTNDNYPLAMETNGTERLRIDETGNVGIGGSPSTFRLSVVGTGQFTGALTVGAYTLPNTDGASGQVLKTDSFGNLTWSDDNDTDTDTFLGLTDTPGSYTAGSVLFTSGVAVTEDNANFFWDDTNNRLGIGTASPSDPLHIVHGTAPRVRVDTGTGNFGQFGATGSSTYLSNSGTGVSDIEIFNTGVVAIDPSGIGVGIGTAIASEQLTVSGAINIGTTTNTNAGTIRWTGTSFQGYEGSDWVPLISSGLEKITETNTGWRLIGMNPANYGDIGSNAVDLSISDAASTVNGATGSYSFAAGRRSRASGDNATALGGFTTASGANATALGGVTTASGDYSLAAGNATEATEDYAIALGRDVFADGVYAFAAGYSTFASGNASVAIGHMTSASGDTSVALGQSTNAPSGYEIAVGSYNTIYTPTSTAGWSANDRLFVVGNGQDAGSRSDALVILKNGNTGIGTASPSDPLHIVHGTAPRVRVDTGTGNFGQFGATGSSTYLSNSGTGVSDIEIFNTGVVAIDPSGVGVGIGTATPDAALTINNTDTAKDSLNVYHDIDTPTFSNALGDTNNYDEFQSVVQTSDGGYIATGQIYVSGYYMYVAKFTSSGTLDTSFGTNGRRTIGVSKGHDIIQTSDGGYLVVGYGSTFGAGGNDLFAVKLTSTGNLDVSFGTFGAVAIGGASTDSGNEVIQVSDGGYVIAGRTDSYGAGSADMYVVKLTSAGVLDGTFGTGGAVTIGGSSSDRAEAIVEANDGGYVLAGYTTSYGAGSNDFYVAKITSAGTLDASFGTGGTAVIGTANNDTAYDIAASDDGGYVIAGFTWDAATNYDVMAVKLTGDGSLDTSFGAGGAVVVSGSGTDVAESITKTVDGGYMLGGNTTSYGAGGRDLYFVKLTTDGSLDDSFGSNGTRTVGGSNYEYTYSVIQAQDSGYVAAGRTSSYGAGSYDAFIVKVDLAGDLAASCSNPSTGSGGSVVTRSVSIGSGGSAGSGSSYANGPLTFNTSVGSLAQQCSASSLRQNQVALNVNQSGYLGVGTVANNNYRMHVNGRSLANAWITSSDKRFKDDITVIDNSLSKLLQLDGVEYFYDTENFSDRGFDERKHFGLLAQDVEKIFPELVYTDLDGYKAVDYTGLISPMINSIKEQNELITVNANDLTTKATALSVTELQTLVDTQFGEISLLLASTQEETEEGATLRDDILALQVEANVLSDNIETIETRLDAIDAGLAILELLGATELTTLEALLAVDPERLVYADEENNVTLEGITTVELLVADKVEAKEISVSSVALEADSDAAIAGQEEFPADATEVKVETEAVTQDSLVFANPLTALDQTLAVDIDCGEVEEEDECTGFNVSIGESIPEPFKFNWFILEQAVE